MMLTGGGEGEAGESGAVRVISVGTLSGELNILGFGGHSCC